ncbi:hypothetical protein [Sphaerotilus mobilis]|uniref:hypothetical protein n=1 Tax=Sphaerotilus mobilis TaxID=47994 RepID=UPI00102D1847|nr:hypothetical protein [Sphaerotilus mobilis]
MSFVEHICAAICTAIQEKAAGSPCAWQAPNIRRFLLEPLDQFLSEQVAPSQPGCRPWIDAAADMYAKAERLAELCEDEYPFDHRDGEVYKTSLRTAWLEFIAHNAAHYVYWIEPKRLAQAKAAASSRKLKGPALTPESIAKHFASNPNLKFEAGVAELAQKHSVSESTVARRYREAKRKNLMS